MGNCSWIFIFFFDLGNKFGILIWIVVSNTVSILVGILLWIEVGIEVRILIYVIDDESDILIFVVDGIELWIDFIYIVVGIISSILVGIVVWDVLGIILRILIDT